MKRLLYIALAALFLPSVAFAQEGLADSLHRSCDFSRARALYDSLLVHCSDSLQRERLQTKRLFCENAEVMSGFVYEPVVIARHSFSRSDFFLYYPFADRTWRTAPNPLDSLPDKGVSATYVPDDVQELYFSKNGGTAVRNIYKTERKDSLWTLPKLVNELLVSPGNEIYPILSADGSKLYFASDGLYGVGGYDLYVSHWDGSDWGAPENLGFPFSSPYDDFLYMDSPDGRYTIFASNRECSQDSVCVYVLEYDSVPVRKEMNRPDLLRQLLSLEPADEGTRLDNGSSVAGDIPENEDTRRYMDKITQVRHLKDSLNTFNQRLDAQRQEFALSGDEDERARLADLIIWGEKVLPELNLRLDEATAELQRIEMDFLFKGVVIDPDKLLAQADRKLVGQSAAYTFTRMNPGPEIQFDFEVPVKKFDYSFKILPKAQYAENQILPPGVVYQIHFITLPVEATTSQLRGLSPVYQTIRPNGHYFYTVGLFSTYADALESLNAVKTRGFRSASVVAYIDGVSVSVAKAREAENVKEYWQININAGSGQLPAELSDIIRSYCDKDIVKLRSEEGITIFVVSPFDKKDNAEELEALIREAGLESVSVSRCEL